MDIISVLWPARDATVSDGETTLVVRYRYDVCVRVRTLVCVCVCVRLWQHVFRSSFRAPRFRSSLPIKAACWLD